MMSRTINTIHAELLIYIVLLNLTSTEKAYFDNELHVLPVWRLDQPIKLYYLKYINNCISILYSIHYSTYSRTINHPIK